MPDDPEPWETNASAPFLAIGDVTIWALGEQRFRVQAPSGAQEVEGFEAARQREHELAGLAGTRE
ncbi:MAG TPA: hypothetical protein VLJ80_05895 [Solirubrobacteraceae bacterium]|nr:hypothetical protein [Solirubrobacteraceae bacterium]